MTITKEQICAILPKANPATIAALMPHFDKYLPQYHIDTAQRLGMFFAQTGEESANYHAFREYASGAEYEGRADLGNTHLGDGVKFKGRGPIQITGESMYKTCSVALYGDDRLLTSPELLEQPEAGVHSACWFWANVKDLNHVADYPENFVHTGPHQYTKTQWATVLINGGLNGYAERLANYQRARGVLKF